MEVDVYVLHFETGTRLCIGFDNDITANIYAGNLNRFLNICQILSLFMSQDWAYLPPKMC